MKALFSRFSLIVLAAVFVLAAATGCQTLTAIHDPDKVTLQSNMEWLAPPLSMGLGYAPADQRVVYLRVRNSSGSNMIDLYGLITVQLQQAGYIITNNPDDAYFSLTADVRFFGETREKDGHKGLLTGTLVGGAAGAVIGHNVGPSSGKYTGVGAVSGAVVGAVIGDTMANRNKIITYSIAVDIRVGERIEAGVKTVRTSNAGGGVGSQAAVSRGRSIESGGSQSGASQEQRVEYTSDFIFQDNRIVASAYKMNLTEGEAVQALSYRIANAVGSILP